MTPPFLDFITLYFDFHKLPLLELCYPHFHQLRIQILALWICLVQYSISSQGPIEREVGPNCQSGWPLVSQATFWHSCLEMALCTLLHSTVWLSLQDHLVCLHLHYFQLFHLHFRHPLQSARSILFLLYLIVLGYLLSLQAFLEFCPVIVIVGSKLISKWWFAWWLHLKPLTSSDSPLSNAQALICMDSTRQILFEDFILDFHLQIISICFFLILYLEVLV